MWFRNVGEGWKDLLVRLERAFSKREMEAPLEFCLEDYLTASKTLAAEAAERDKIYAELHPELSLCDKQEAGNEKQNRRRLALRLMRRRHR
jgi:hypothetical protein